MTGPTPAEVLARWGGTATRAQLLQRASRLGRGLGDRGELLSAAESVALDAGLRVRPQVPVLLASGWIREDLADEERRLLVEAGSLARHGSRSALERDCRRDDEAVRAGWLAALLADVAALRGAQNRTVANVPTRRKPTDW